MKQTIYHNRYFENGDAWFSIHSDWVLSAIATGEAHWIPVGKHPTFTDVFHRRLALFKQRAT